MKKFISVFLTFAMLCGTAASAESVIHTEWGQADESVPAATAGSGKCGDNLTWTLTEDGTLTISGTGEMYEYYHPDDFDDVYDPEYDYTIPIPWYENNNAKAVKSLIIEDGVKSICNGAFFCASITTVKLPDSVKSIGVNSFSSCDKLTSVILSNNIERIPAGAFISNSNLESIYLPPGLKSIAEEAFTHCCKLKNIVIPASVTNIKDLAFFDCTSLEEVVIPDKMLSVNSGTFEDCNNLKSVILPKGLKVIEDSAFANCANLEEIILPDGLMEIGSNALTYNINDRNPGLGKQKIYIPDSVNEINKYAIDENSVIYGFKNSVAEAYAKEKNIEFIEVTESMYDEDSCSKAKEIYDSKAMPDISEIAAPLPTPEPEQMPVISVMSANGEVKVSVNNKEVVFPDGKPFIDENSRTQIPVRALAEALGCEVDYDDETQLVTVTDKENIITLTIGSRTLTKNGTASQMDTEAIISADRTYIPARFIAEALGFEVKWNAK